MKVNHQLNTKTPTAKASEFTMVDVVVRTAILTTVVTWFITWFDPWYAVDDRFTLSRMLSVVSYVCVGGVHCLGLEWLSIVGLTAIVIAPTACTVAEHKYRFSTDYTKLKQQYMINVKQLLEHHAFDQLTASMPDKTLRDQSRQGVQHEIKLLTDLLQVDRIEFLRHTTDTVQDLEHDLRELRGAKLKQWQTVLSSVAYLQQVRDALPGYPLEYLSDVQPLNDSYSDLERLEVVFAHSENQIQKWILQFPEAMANAINSLRNETQLIQGKVTQLQESLEQLEHQCDNLGRTQRSISNIMYFTC